MRTLDSLMRHGHQALLAGWLDTILQGVAVYDVATFAAVGVIVSVATWCRHVPSCWTCGRH